MRIQSTISSITEMLKFLPDSRYFDRATINEYSSSSTAATLSEEHPRNPLDPVPDGFDHRGKIIRKTTPYWNVFSEEHW
jgi:hypothetical protein